MDDDEIISKAKSLIRDNLYLTLSTVDKTGKYPLSTPVFYAIDNNFKFIYWVSSYYSHHSNNILHNPNVCAVIFNSTVQHGHGFGVYISGTVDMITDLSEIQAADNLMKYKLYIDDNRSAEYYCPPNKRRIYRLHRENIWVNTTIEENNQYMDVRRDLINFD